MGEETENGYINLREIFADIKRKKYFILRITCLFLCLGLVVALFGTKEYEAKSVVLPQGSGGLKIGGSLGGLAAMAGINLGSVGGSTSTLPAELYQNVFNNVHFQKELLQTNITLSKFSENVTIFKYITAPEYKHFLWFRRLKAQTIDYYANKKRQERLAERRAMMERSAGAEGDSIKTPEFVPMSEVEYNACKALSSIVSIVVNVKNNSVTITARMPEPVAAAQVASAVETLLHDYIVKYKTQKAQDYLNFVQDRFTEAEAEYQDKRDKLAQYQDANKALNTATAQARLTRLEEESLAAFDVYASLTSQLEQAKISVKENTPVFMSLEPVAVPTEPVGTSKMAIIVIFLFMGVAIPLCIIVFKTTLLDIYPSEKLSAWYEREDKLFWGKLIFWKKKSA